MPVVYLIGNAAPPLPQRRVADAACQGSRQGSAEPEACRSVTCQRAPGLVAELNLGTD